MSDLYYIEEGYLEPKYYVYIALGNVAMGPYIDEGYIEANYYEDYSAAGSLTCTAQVVVGQEVIANGSFSSSTTMSAAVSKLVDASAAFTSAFTQSAIGLRDRDIDLFAFSDAAIAVQVEVTRTTNVELSTVFSIAIDGSRVRYIDAAEESLFNFDAVVERSLRGFQSQTQAAFSLSAEANPNTKQLIATTPMVATLAAIGGFIKQNSANLTVFARIQTSRSFGSGRPRDLDDNFVNTIPNFDNSIKKFGTHSLLCNKTSGSIAVTKFTNPGIVPKQSEDFYFEGWIYPKNLTASNNFNIDDFLQIGITNDGRFQYIGRIQNLANPSGTTSAYGYTHTTQATINTWNHLAVVKQSNSISFYINGTRVNYYVEGNPSLVVPFRPWSRLENTTRDGIIVVTLRDPANIDEIMFVKGNTLGLSTSQTTIPVPTQPRTNSISGVEFLYHFDNNVLDDIFLTQTVSASLTSTASITAKLSGPEKASANLTSTTSLTTVISHIEGADLTAFANASLTASAINLRGFESTQQSEFAVSVNAVKVTDANSSISANNTIIVNNERIRDNAIATDSVATQLSAVVRLAGLFADDISVFEMSVKPVKTTDTQSNQSANFTQLTDNFRVRFNQADLSSQFIETSDVFVGVVASSHIDAEFTQTTQTSRIRDNTISANSVSTVECIANNLGKIEGSLFNQASMSIVAVKTVFVESLQNSNVQAVVQTQNSVTKETISSLESQFTSSINAIKNIGTFAFLTAFASNLTIAVKDVVSDSDMNVIASMTIDAVKNVNAISNLLSVTEQLISATKNAIGEISANSEFTQDTNAITVLNAHADFDSISSTLAAVVKIGDFFINADVVANANINGTVIRSANSNNQINTNVSVIGSVTKHADSVQSAQFNQTVAGSLLVSANANIQSAMQFVAAVRELRLDDIVYVIPAEIWEYQIGAETREYAIGSETREYIIQGD